MLYQGSLAATDDIRAEMRQFLRKDENQVLDHLLPLADISNAARSRAWERARKLVLRIRAEQSGKGGVDALLQEYALSTEEGVVLMCLAEALLRVPDRHTIDRLIRDKLADGNWSSHLGNSESIFVNASAWGLLLTGKMVNYNDEDKSEQFGLLRKTMGRLGEPVIRASVRYAMQVMGTQFVMGTTIDSAVERAREVEAKGYRYSYDMLGEGARTLRDAERYYTSYVNAIEVIGRAAAGRGPVNSPGISVKLSAIHPRYEFAQRERVMSELVPKLKALALAAKAKDIGFTVDAEEADRLDISLDVIEAVFSDPDLGDWAGFGIAVQAYQKRGIFVIEWLRALTQRTGRKMMVRLVKGAYWDTEIKLAQVEGEHDFPVFSRKPSTDVSYQACAAKLLAYRDTLYPQFATHNAYTVATILEMSQDRTGYEFQRLHGMGDALYDQVVGDDKVPCRVYAPVGVHADLLAYLVRRLLENGANSSFVNNIVDEDIPVESLLEDPVEQVRHWQDKRNPHIPLPADLYGAERRNSEGMDLTDPLVLEPAREAMDRWLEQLPLDYSNGGEVVEVRNPADHNELVGRVSFADDAAIAGALDRAHTAFPAWAGRPVSERADILRRIADALEAHRDELIALCAKEAGKSIPDGVAEVREAVDFCRYYAARAESADFAAEGLKPRGVVLCISPWNFPLAIFLGQVSAALVTGNTVIAKPAEQTSLIASRTIELARQCGLPEHVLELLIAPGPPVGEKLVPDTRIKAVMFTGSTETGAWLYRTLAAREDAPVPLVCETGGQNCMIVDSTALPEQVVDDVIASGFQSAGQRCSALRVLFLQDEIADKVIDMIGGAMRELRLGDPTQLHTDIGPVIDAKARARLEEHVQYLEGAGRLLHACETPGGDNHTFFAPRLYEISNLSLLPREVFGPVVHVVRYRAEDFRAVMEQINQTGYGLTFGIHSRIEDACEDAARRVSAGNIYVNRNMIGAIVGVQPFGGRGLSGTGPKAGGPQYLTRLVTTGEEAENAADQCPLPSGGRNVDAPLRSAKATQASWSGKSLNDRTSVLRQFIASYTERPAADDPLMLENTLGAARDQLRFASECLGQPVELPGPTGESNSLILEPRGSLAIVLDNPGHNSEYLMAILSVLVGGNALTAFASDDLLGEWRELGLALEAAGLPREVFQVVPLASAADGLVSPSVDGVLVHARSVHLHAVAQKLAERDGAIIPLISCVSPRTLLRQTQLEKAVSIDTTASGGNASLMTMPA
ncbi:bifunctional proline dehydrogenase/L-glutamate gamma-semialdehyde dehydrogenase PutA [Parahaliea mediterranea]|uniref:Bifunctional protein PutA n=1 Tax=Parahaliea mediterranea TaxID=651086 RepID=A0A939DI67_9GAMM|nr:bifunctional proline dehydrogenase/L-glutamate gamma-semialdehyde dehydrogenase PutA [Parahaliea mediterranea]MBN7797922.1 bifunctional proline dehydrogenase/L-glutamate gamma-semialdehyde dehydrogenase PutA [Parahaliea mediterranea]